jgi:hypothetical protein
MPPRPFTRVTSRGLARGLAQKAVPLADRLRDIFTKFALRPYIVRLVVTRWTSEVRGKGVETVARALVIEPTPLVTDLEGVVQINSPVGLDELGDVLLQEISGRFTEDQLRGHAPDGTPVAENENFYYEIEFPPPGAVNRDGERRRFSIKGVPYYHADRFQWNVTLTRARGDRKRSGAPR